MIRTLTEEEVKRANERIAVLHKSEDLKDRITGILCDTKVGSTGLHEPTARIKAEALVQLFEVWQETNWGLDESSKG
tara:strand:- start:4279 stop:4509 length:231 start_codon:yes stop_codon:yes gene_type:complete